MLRLNSTGPVVVRLQRDLAQAGLRLHEDGYFGHSTEAAVRLFQKRHALLPDGIAGQVTLRALEAGKPKPATSSTPPARQDVSPFAAVVDSAVGYAAALSDLVTKVGAAVLPWATRALYALEHPDISRPARSLTMSPDGKSWLFGHEAQPGRSNRLYWPGGASGVTLGAGYDMKERSAARIRTDMLKLGLSPQAAEVASKGAGKTGSADAGTFADNNREAIVLTHDQELSLLNQIVPSYEGMVQRNLTVDLLRHEFDALVSFAYNPGRKFMEVARLVNAGEVAKAMALIKTRVYSGNTILPGLVKRRNDEVNAYLYGRYEKT